MRRPPRIATIAVAFIAALALAGRPARADEPLDFTPDTTATRAHPFRLEREETWLKAPFGDHLLTDVDEWRASEHQFHDTDFLADYNRVDRLRIGVRHELQWSDAMAPRFGARIEYAFGRERTLYGVQLEQPLAPPGRLAFGVSALRRTDHNDLHQVEDPENSLALLFGRQDYRDYFEREGFGAYLAWRVPDFSTVSVHLRSDDYRSLATDPRTRSWFHRDRTLRANPAIDAGEMHSVLIRLERLAHRTHRTRAGLYHWIEFERSGAGLGGRFGFTRALADVRSVFRLSPATTFAVRAVGGHTPAGDLPLQKEFTVGGVDGLRAHEFGSFRGDQMLLAQAEYTAGLWRITSHIFEGGLHAIAFVDVGRAWTSRSRTWDVFRQPLEADGGFGLSTSEDNMRVYVARNLKDPGSPVVVSLRLQRPF